MRRDASLNSWKAKLDPAFLRFFTQVLKPVVEEVPPKGTRHGRGTSSQTTNQVMSGFVERLKNKFGAPSELQVEHIIGPTALPQLQHAFMYLSAFWYFQERPESLLARDAMGDRQASYDLVTLNKIVTALRYLDPISPPKVDALHWSVFMIGWKAGLQTLKPDELALCFDEICPRHVTHDPDALRKQRKRAAQAIKKFDNVFYVSSERNGDSNERG